MHVYLKLMNRRSFVKSSLLAGGTLLSYQGLGGGQQPAAVPVRAITRGPRYHWFGYYDKLQFDPAGRYVLGMEVAFEHRSPKASDSIGIGMVDLAQNDRWIALGDTRAWGWQQGCMLQWIPASPNKMIWNDRAEAQGTTHFISKILDVSTGELQMLPKAIYTLSPDGRWGLGVEFSRIQNLRPGYGYAGVADPHEAEKAPEEIGLYKIDLQSGDHHLLFSLHDIAAIPHQGQSVLDNYHWINHVLVSPDGSRFTFLHRWRPKRLSRQQMAVGGFTTRMFTAAADGSDLFCIDPSGHTSHFIWKDPDHLFAYTRPEGEPWGFYVLTDKTGAYRRVGADKMPVNGHQTYLPIGSGQEWVLNDNYAHAKDRTQTPYLYHIPTDRRIELGHFVSPPAYTGEWRCDLHPRFSPDGTRVVIDSAHGGNGRQMYLLDISEVVKQ